MHLKIQNQTNVCDSLYKRTVSLIIQLTIFYSVHSAREQPVKLCFIVRSNTDYDVDRVAVSDSCFLQVTATGVMELYRK